MPAEPGEFVLQVHGRLRDSFGVRYGNIKLPVRKGVGSRFLCWWRHPRTSRGLRAVVAACCRMVAVVDGRLPDCFRGAL